MCLYSFSGSNVEGTQTEVNTSIKDNAHSNLSSSVLPSPEEDPIVQFNKTLEDSVEMKVTPVVSCTQTNQWRHEESENENRKPSPDISSTEETDSKPQCTVKEDETTFALENKTTPNAIKDHKKVGKKSLLMNVASNVFNECESIDTPGRTKSTAHFNSITRKETDKFIQLCSEWEHILKDDEGITDEGIH